MKKYWIISAILLVVLAAEILLGIYWFGGFRTARTEPSVPQETVPATTATEPIVTEEPTTVPTEPPVIHRNPLNGQIIQEPFTDRVFALTISNMHNNLPHVGLMKADVIIEAFVNRNNVVRCLALFSDISSAEAIGSTRSTRPVLNNMTQHYSAILAHAGGTEQSLTDARNRGIENFSIDHWDIAETGASYRDKEYKRSYENSLFGVGSGIKAYAESAGYPMELEKDYGFRFTDYGTPEGGESAGTISVTFTYKGSKKETIMIYDGKLNKYVWNQYNKSMTDQITGEPEAFSNVLILHAPVSHNGLYHSVALVPGGSGYYANGGTLIPITYTCSAETEAPRFFTEDGQELLMGTGNTYMAICSLESSVSWTAYEPPVETEPAETVAETAPETTSETVEGEG